MSKLAGTLQFFVSMVPISLCLGCMAMHGKSSAPAPAMEDIRSFMENAYPIGVYFDNYGEHFEDNEWITRQLHAIRTYHDSSFEDPTVFPVLYTMLMAHGIPEQYSETNPTDSNWLHLWRTLPVEEKPLYYMESELGDDFYRTIEVCLTNYTGEPLRGLSRIGALMIYCGGETNPAMTEHCHKVSLEDDYTAFSRLVCQ